MAILRDKSPSVHTEATPRIARAADASTAFHELVQCYNRGQYEVAVGFRRYLEDHGIHVHFSYRPVCRECGR